MELNQRTADLCQQIIADAARLRVDVSSIAGATVVDAGIAAAGGLEAGLALAEVCLAGLAKVGLAPQSAAWRGPAITVATDHPIAACMASQYAGWQIVQGRFFAMGSGPMRAAASKEPLFERIGHREQPKQAVGVLETRKLPTAEVIDYIAAACQVAPSS